MYIDIQSDLIKFMLLLLKYFDTNDLGDATIINDDTVVSYSSEVTTCIVALQSLLSHRTEYDDVANFTEKIIECMSLTNTPALRIIKLILQGVVLEGMQRLKTDILSNIMTKDIKQRRGWLVYISLLSRDHIIVSHKRREQASQQREDKNNFEIEWEIKVELTNKANTIAVSIHIYIYAALALAYCSIFVGCLYMY